MVFTIQKANLVDIKSSRFWWYSFVFERTPSRLVYFIFSSNSLNKIKVLCIDNGSGVTSPLNLRSILIFHRTIVHLLGSIALNDESVTPELPPRVSRSQRQTPQMHNPDNTGLDIDGFGQPAKRRRISNGPPSPIRSTPRVSDLSLYYFITWIYY